MTGFRRCRRSTDVPASQGLTPTVAVPQRKEALRVGRTMANDSPRQRRQCLRVEVARRWLASHPQHRSRGHPLGRRLDHTGNGVPLHQRVRRPSSGGTDRRPRRLPGVEAAGHWVQNSRVGIESSGHDRPHPATELAQPRPDPRPRRDVIHRPQSATIQAAMIHPRTLQTAEPQIVVMDLPDRLQAQSR